MTYRIIRFTKFGQYRGLVIKQGLTLEQAKEHCNDPKTEGDGWFDGYEKEGQ